MIWPLHFYKHHSNMKKKKTLLWRSSSWTHFRRLWDKQLPTNTGRVRPDSECIAHLSAPWWSFGWLCPQKRSCCWSSPHTPAGHQTPLVCSSHREQSLPLPSSSPPSCWGNLNPASCGAPGPAGSQQQTAWKVTLVRSSFRAEAEQKIKSRTYRRTCLEVLHDHA